MKRLFKRKNVYHVISILVYFFIISTPAIASFDYFPTEGWRMSTPEEQGMHSENLLKMMENIKESQIGIQSVTVMRNGYIVLDSYIHPYEDGQKHKMFSITKSIISALIGIAINKGFIKDVDQKIVEIFPNKEIKNLDDRKKSITVKHLLMMVSGLQANDGWEKNWVGLFDMQASDNWTQYTLNLPMEANPGERFEYYNCNSHLLSAIINKTTGMKTIDFANKYLFEPIGIKNVKWDTSPEGVNIGYVGLWLEPKEMAKIGLLYLNKGKWNGIQIISSNWIEESTKPYHDSRLRGQKYGYQWWINPAGFYSANGMYGQFIDVVPDKNLVAVFTGNIDGAKQSYSFSLLKDYISTAIASSEPLPAKPKDTADLNAFVDKLAKTSDDIITWKGKNNGFAQDGVFKRTADPSFTFEYPMGSTRAELANPAFQVMRMKTPEGVVFDAAVMDIPEAVNLADFGSKIYAKNLESVGSDVKVVSNKEITLKCGAKAYRSDINWLWNNSFPLNTVLVSAYKNGKCIHLATHPMGNPEKVAQIVQSLTLK